MQRQRSKKDDLIQLLLRSGCVNSVGYAGLSTLIKVLEREGWLFERAKLGKSTKYIVRRCPYREVRYTTPDGRSFTIMERY